MTKIIVTHENNEVDEHEFEPEIRTITIGRRSTNDVCVANLSVSGTHAKIMLSETGALVEDLNSTNGTYINGRLISRQLLNDGDDIVMGRVQVTYVAALPHPDQSSDIDSMFDEPLTLTEHPDQQTLDAIDQATEGNRPEAATAADEGTTLAEPRLAKSAAIAKAPQKGRPANEVAQDLSSDLDDDLDDMPVLTPVRDTTRNPASDGVKDRIVPAREPVSATEVVHNLDGVSTTSAVIEIKNGAKSGQVLPIDKPVTTLGRPGIQIAAIMKKPDGYFLMHIESDDEVAPPQLNNNSIGDVPVLLQSGDALNVAGIDVQFMLS